MQKRSQNSEKLFSCDQCNKKTEQNSTNPEGSHSEVNQFSCPHCEINFNQADALEEHERIHRGENPYKCAQCDRSFALKNSLEVHM